MLRTLTSVGPKAACAGTVLGVAARRWVSHGGHAWSYERDGAVYKYKKAEEIIDTPMLEGLLDQTKRDAQDVHAVRDILQKAREHALLKGFNTAAASEYVQGLTLKETATLLNVPTEHAELMNELFDSALQIKQTIYGKRIVLFAPLYLANWCVGSCLYCGYRAANKDIPRSILTNEEIKQEVTALQKQGHKRLLLLSGEHPKYTFDNFLDALHLVADIKAEPHGEIRRINVEIPPVSVYDMKRLKATDKCGTYALFQETYHPATYKIMHPYGPKSDYEFRLLTMDRAQLGGMDDVGIGALFGLHDYRFEVMGLLAHAQHLDATYNVGPHTISIPRIKPAMGAPMAENVPHEVDDINFKKLVAILRCAVPYTGMILSTRESPAMRKELLNLGISQMSAGSHTEVGGYTGVGEAKERARVQTNDGDECDGQFSVSDVRPTPQVIKELMLDGYIPSWCTACYRLGRTGEKFMKIAKKGAIHNFCQPNALSTLAEYLHDYGDEEARKIGWNLIEREKEFIPSEIRRAALEQQLEDISQGKRDLFF